MPFKAQPSSLPCDLSRFLRFGGFWVFLGFGGWGLFACLSNKKDFLIHLVILEAGQISCMAATTQNSIPLLEGNTEIF